MYLEFISGKKYDQNVVPLHSCSSSFYKENKTPLITEFNLSDTLTLSLFIKFRSRRINPIEEGS